MSLENEQALLGACLLIERPEGYDRIASRVGGEDWSTAAHRTLWALFGAMREQGVPLDPVLVKDEAARRGQLQHVGDWQYLLGLYERAGSVGSLEHHAAAVAEQAMRRRMTQAGTRITQRAESPDVDPADLLQWAHEQLAEVRDTRAGVEVLTKGYDAFMHDVPEQRRMVIPGLLGEGDRVVLTGSGGLGKSTMFQQIAVCAAAGMPPFDYRDEDPYDPARVTIIDCENADHRLKTRLWPIVKEAREAGLDPVPNLTIGGHGNPLNLLDPAVALSLLRTIEHDKPDLLYIGPVYKLHNDDPDKEVVVKKITDVLDRIRAMGVAVMTEAHHTKGGGKRMESLEPSGSNLWTWWPEFGLGLRLIGDSDPIMRRCTLERWRIDRDASSWPTDVEASGLVGLPWLRSPKLPYEYGEARTAGYGRGVSAF